MTLPLLWLSGLVRGDSTGEVEFFEKKIRPVLVRECYECHSAAKEEPGGGLRLDFRDGARKGGESGPAVVPGDVSASLLISAMRHESFEMPPKKKLDQLIIDDFVRWIADGAVDPRDNPPEEVDLASSIWEETFNERKQWWSFQPVQSIDVPRTRHAKTSVNDIDRFIVAQLRKHRLLPSPRASKEVLIRRLAYTLTGLPPTTEQVDRFLNDRSAEAWEAAIEQFLGDQHFGERFARHWMDVIRYTDTYGYEWDIPASTAWRYRDYLIRAFNDDIPFDQMVREQIAGDLLKEPRVNQQLMVNESAIGPMFYQLGEHRHGDSSEFEGIHQEMLDNKIDAFSKAFQGITIACARCHDHKLDPIAQSEYYALAGVFMSSRWVRNTVDLPGVNDNPIAEIERLKPLLKKRMAAVWLQDIQNNITVESLGMLPESPLPIGDINYPWQKLYKLEDAEIPAAWQALKESLTTAEKEAREFNAANYKVLFDFSNGVPDEWDADGDGLAKVVSRGDFQILPTGPQFIESLYLPGIATASISSRLNGALRSPFLSTIETVHVSVLSAGGDQSAFRRVVDNAFLTEKQTYFDNPRYQWKVMSTSKGMEHRRIFYELATKTSNPNFPPRVGLGKKLTDQEMQSPRSWFAVNKIVGQVGPSPPKKELSAFLPLFDQSVPQNKAEAAQYVRDWLSGVIRRWRDEESTDDEIQLLNNLLVTAWISKNSDHPEFKELVANYRELESKIQTPKTVNTLEDIDDGVNYRLNIRGSYYELGDAIPRGYLRVLAGGSEPHAFDVNQSGRLELAELVVNPENPLTARVYVNRIWHWLFGAGIVDTPSNFGKLGGAPSHPELLDWLATQFVENGWSTKHLMREILMSHTWRQSGVVSSRALDTDPTNRLLHHFPTQRLTAECIGDAMLAVSGSLDDKLFGHPINPYRTAENDMKYLFSGPVDNNGRRMIYTKVTIMEPAKFLSTFNQPDPKIPTGRRDLTNTPIQALALLNDPFVVEMANNWSTEVTEDGNSQPEDRLYHMLREAYSRDISLEEVSKWKSAVEDLARLHEISPTKIMESQKLWADVAHAIFNSKEFIYVR